MARPPLKVKKVPVTIFVFEDKAKQFKEEAQALADRLNGAEKVIEAVTKLEEIKANLAATNDRDNPLINAARGRDANGVNNDEAKPMVKLTKQELRAKLSNTDIEKQIAAIRAEKIPEERDTVMGRKVWQADQNKRIADIKNK